MTTKEKINLIEKAQAMSDHKREKVAEQLMGRAFSIFVNWILIFCFIGIAAGAILWIWIGVIGWKIILTSFVIMTITYAIWKATKKAIVDYINKYQATKE